MKPVSKKIVFVANTAFTITNFRKELIKSFVEENYEVIVACPTFCSLSNIEDVSSSLRDLGARHYPLLLSRSGINPFSDIKLFISLLKLFKKEQPYAVLNYTIKPVIYSSIAAKISSSAKVYSTITGLGYLFTSKSLKNRIIAFIVKLQYFLALQFNTLVFFQNSDDLNLFKKMRLLNNVKTKIINGSGVDLNKFFPSENVKLKFSFIMIGRILKDKGIDEYISAARGVKKKYPEAVFKLLGSLDDNPSAYRENDILKWEKEGVIIYIKPQKDVRPFLAESEVFVLPSYREGTPRATLEAMAMGLPVITADSPGCRETVIDGENGFLVTVKDSYSLQIAIEKMITNRQLINKMGAKSLHFVKQKYDVNLVNASILEEII